MLYLHYAISHNKTFTDLDMTYTIKYFLIYITLLCTPLLLYSQRCSISSEVRFKNRGKFNQYTFVITIKNTDTCLLAYSNPHYRTVIGKNISIYDVQDSLYTDLVFEETMATNHLERQQLDTPIEDALIRYLQPKQEESYFFELWLEKPVREFVLIYDNSLSTLFITDLFMQLYSISKDISLEKTITDKYDTIKSHINGYKESLSSELQILSYRNTLKILTLDEYKQLLSNEFSKLNHRNSFLPIIKK